ncbi:MAG: HPr family phosphocarrier protein [Firmicutes bacterium]|nr:HPr family phosphocarrier protein [Bacillota bacterium]MBR0105373.1 HPr family phosphocarrier protein [Bacillota bacterium]MBR2594603.1 HPr family phosphocarrier protein [Bacillota bacterium]
MIEKDIKVSVNFDTRQAAFFVQTANRFESKLELILEGKRINAKSIMGTISLGITEGCDLKILAEGKDEEKAVADLSAVLVK